MKMYSRLGVILCSIYSTIAYASSDAGSGGQMPWEVMIEKFASSLSYLGYFLCIIGIIWAGYGFIVQNEKESGFKRLLATLIGATIIFGSKGILNTMVGAHF